MAKYRKGDRVVVKGGRHSGYIGRIRKPTDITTSKNEVEGTGGSTRPSRVRVTNKQLDKVAEPKQSLWAWFWSK